MKPAGFRAPARPAFVAARAAEGGSGSWESTRLNFAAVKLTVTALCCAALALTVFVPSAGAAPLSGPGDEICQVLGDNGGTYFLSVTSRRDNDLSQCDAGTPLQANIDDLLGNPKYGPNVDRRCIYDITTDPTVDAIVGVYSSGRDIDRAAARNVCQLHHGY